MGRGGHEEADDDPAVTSPLLIYPDFPLDVSGFFPGKHLPNFSQKDAGFLEFLFYAEQLSSFKIQIQRFKIQFQ